MAGAMSCNGLHHSCVCRTEAILDLLETVEKQDRFIREAGYKSPPGAGRGPISESPKTPFNLFSVGQEKYVDW